MTFGDEVIQIRALEPGDMAALRRWINDPETARYLSASWPVSSSEQNKWYDRLAGDASKKKLLIETVAGDAIGVLSLTNIDERHRSVEIGITIGSADHRRQGYARRALGLALDVLFGHFNFHRVSARILTTNEASLALFGRMGFTVEGVLRESAYWEGRMIGTTLMSILRHEHAAAGGGNR